MKPTIEILERISQNSKKNKDEVFTRLYRYMLRSDLYYLAYQKLYSNNGAATKGVNSDTADGFGEEKVQAIIKSLADETYTPKPARRTYIKKSNGKLRPLGIPTFTDKLVQQVLKMILEAVYEPLFLDCSHGFRPNRSCHTALKSVKLHFTGIRWFVEGDIKGCFDNIDHRTLVGFIGNKIKDARLIKLVWKMLKAGYCEDWKYFKTYSGTPQGGIISPLFANIYLHELDKYVAKLTDEYNKPGEALYTKEYLKLHGRICYINKKLRTATEAQKVELLKERKLLQKQQLATPSRSQTDKKLKYIRYADDFLIGVNGNREDCVAIKEKLTRFIASVLKMELSAEKTLITHSNEYARFLGYDVRVRRDNTINPIIRDGKKRLMRLFNGTVELNIPFDDKIMPFLFEKGIVYQENGKIKPTHRRKLLRCTELEILTAFNAELRGICNYYSMASNFNRLDYFSFLMEYSCLRTLANKHKSSVKKIKERYKDGKGGWCIPYETKQGEKVCYFAKYMDCKKTIHFTDEFPHLTTIHLSSRTSFESRLAAKQCELCGSVEAEHYEVHHVNKVKNLIGKEAWERRMIAKNRKTMVLCRECHHKIHE